MATSGEAKLSVTLNGGIQSSNFNNNAFRIENTGIKAISKVEIDVTGALFPDAVFDPFGLAGDTAFKKLTINTNGLTGVVAPSDQTSYIGTGGKSGYETIQILFDPAVNGGFQPGEALGFSIDMDPNSVAGSLKATLDAGSTPTWDVGGVSGAELVGSTFTVTFTDGTTARGQLQAVANTATSNSQGGAQALATEVAPVGSVTLTVDGLAPGAAGTYDDAPQVIVSGPAGQVARVVLAKGMAQPLENLFDGAYAAQFDAQMTALQASAFPANNAVSFQVHDVVLTGAPQNITSLFNFTSVPVAGVLNGDRLPLGFVAGLIDKANGDLPVGPVTAPIHLRAVNAAPLADDDTVTVAAGESGTLAVLADDTDADGDTLSLWSFTQGANGSVVRNADGTLTYTPRAGFSGTDSFGYTAIDGLGGRDAGTVSVNVQAAAAAAVEMWLIDPLTDQRVGRIADGQSIDPDLLSGGQYSIEVVPDPSLGARSVKLTLGSQVRIEGAAPYALFGDSSGNFAGVALPSGPQTLLVQVYSGTNASGTLLFDQALDYSFVAPAPNAAPVAGDDVATGAEDAAITVSVLGNDRDSDGGVLSVTAVTQGANGAVAVNANGTLTYTPKANFFGTDSFTYTVSDGQGGTDTASVSVTVSPVNDAPVAGDDTGRTAAGQAVTVSVLGNDSDVDGGTLSVGSVTQGANGAVVKNADGTLTYTPRAGFSGADSFTYTVSDGQGGTDTASVAVTVDPAAGATLVAAVNAGGPAFTAADGDAHAADQFFTGGKAYKKVAAIAGTVDDALYQTERFGNFTYAVPVENGTYEVTLKFAEIFFSAAGQRVFDVAAEGQVVINDLDIWSAAGGKNIAYDVPVTVQVSDGVLNLQFINGIENAKVNAIEINRLTGPAPNAAPVAGADAATTSTDTPVMIDVLANDRDSDGGTLRIQGATAPANGTATVDDRGTSATTDDRIVYTPKAGFTGTDTFSYTVADGQGGTDTETVTVSVESPDQVAFTTVSLTGIPDKSYTSIQFGPDGRLYASSRFGEIFAIDVEQRVDASGKIIGYAATRVETINLINTIPNHNDDGTLNTAITNRQVTGIVVAGTADRPVIYVGSSDPREGGGSGGGKGDTGLDTNSGVLSRLSWNGALWEKVDLVRGLPRSEENHSTNGLALTTDPETGHKVLLVAQGGHTNAGAPSVNFAYSNEYALSAAILEVDLTVLESGTGAYSVKTDGAHRYVYDIPTVLGPVFGGQDGLNQARLVAGGPVQVYSSGYRNPYDVVVTEAGEVYTIDNGANQGWGGLPDGEGTTNVTNKIPTLDPNGSKSVNNLDHLEYIPQAGYYAGHPNPVRANPTGAGVTYTSASGTETWTQRPPGTWPPVDPGLSFPEDGDFRLPGVEDDALVTWAVSTNGLDEYTASNFGGALKGSLIAAAFDSSIYRIDVDPTKSGATKEAIASGLSGTPLDVIAQGDFDRFPGTIWIAYVAGTSDIQVLVPTTVNGTANDLDGDGYSNEDELANGTNPNSPSSIPPDNDTDRLSDLRDLNDDNDGQADRLDHFALDAANGTALTVTGSEGFFNPLRNDNPGYGFSGLGFTGWMSNGTADYLNQYDDDNLIAGGTSGIFTIIQTTSGDARGSLNTQDNGFQFGVRSDLAGSGFDSFLVNARMLSVFAPLTAAQLANGQSAGIQIGTGDQDNYIKLAVASNGGKLAIAVLREEGGQVSETFIPATIPIGAQVDLFFQVNPTAGTVTPAWQVDGGELQTGAAITLAADSEILSAIRGTYQNGTEPSALAVGVIATHGSTGTPFSAQYDHINVYAGSLATQATTTVLLAESNLEALTFDANDTFIFGGDLTFEEVSRLNLDRPLPPGILIREALPPGLAKRDVLPPGLDKKDVLPPGLQKRVTTEQDGQETGPDDRLSAPLDRAASAQPEASGRDLAGVLAAQGAEDGIMASADDWLAWA
ncbi:Ig-like domain-containing protein [Rubellimicrobium roseum]|uniref:Tandem-95 repeat protein n=1 Tax=Rubellimicrobium roseum TaxID=687525 RepID=A0A5C4NPP5_9RHOB|nr:cadherin-like domain-containing protein [Rubellimicrobium roseum]TNC74607.1 tandem-95 repeat protein [Rubellimicrobium roseum]